MSIHAFDPSRRAETDRAARAEVSHLEHTSSRLGKLLGECDVMQTLFGHIERIAPTSINVMVTGESGTGKELVAETVHALSGRAAEPFIAVNCGAIPATLVEAELFGHERGSFTGAIRTQTGCFERAGGGTLFLDEAAEMPLDMQVKLLRALESRTIRRVGGDRDIPVAARVISATNQTPMRAVADNRLRADLLYRLAVFHLEMPALRQRGDDVFLVAHHFLAALNQSEGTHKTFSKDSLEYLGSHTWPGNVRELCNAVQRAFILGDAEVDLRTTALYGPRIEAPATSDSTLMIRRGMSLSEIERIAITETLKECCGNKSRTAVTLGISLKTLYNRLNEYRALEGS